MSETCRLRRGEGYGACDDERACQGEKQTTRRPNRVCLSESERETGKGEVCGQNVHLAKIQEYGVVDKLSTTSNINESNFGSRRDSSYEKIARFRYFPYLI